MPASRRFVQLDPIQAPKARIPSPELDLHREYIRVLPLRQQVVGILAITDSPLHGVVGFEIAPVGLRTRQACRAQGVDLAPRRSNDTSWQLMPLEVECPPPPRSRQLGDAGDVAGLGVQAGSVERDGPAYSARSMEDEAPSRFSRSLAVERHGAASCRNALPMRRCQGIRLPRP